MKESRDSSPQRREINWPTVIFLIISPLVGFGGLAWWIADARFNWETIALAVVLAFATGMGITGGYHRLFSHRSYEAAWPVRVALVLFGGATFEGSVWEWCTDHRRHHIHVDEDEDPYNINQGFWHAHILWLFFKGRTLESPEPTGAYKDLWRDPLLRFQHRYYLPLATAVSFGLPAMIASLWGDIWGGLLVAGALRQVLVQQFTFAINSVCHKFGRQTYSTRHSARDNWVTALFTYGEGYHNYHHEFPGDYRNGIRFYHWDPTKWMIGALQGLGLVKNLVRVPPESILVRKLTVKEARLREKLPTEPGALTEFANRVLETTRAQVNDAAQRLRTLRSEYRNVKRKGGFFSQYPKLRAQLRQAEREFRQTVALWESTARRLQKILAANHQASLLATGTA